MPPPNSPSSVAFRCQARMNAGLHMAGELKEATGAGNLFVILADIEITPVDEVEDQVKIHSRCFFHPSLVQCNQWSPTKSPAGSLIRTGMMKASSYAILLPQGPVIRCKSRNNPRPKLTKKPGASLCNDISRQTQVGSHCQIKVINHLGMSRRF